MVTYGFRLSVTEERGDIVDTYRVRHTDSPLIQSKSVYNSTHCLVVSMQVNRREEAAAPAAPIRLLNAHTYTLTHSYGRRITSPASGEPASAIFTVGAAPDGPHAVGRRETLHGEPATAMSRGLPPPPMQWYRDRPSTATAADRLSYAVSSSVSIETL